MTAGETSLLVPQQQPEQARPNSKNSNSNNNNNKKKKKMNTPYFKSVNNPLSSFKKKKSKRDSQSSSSAASSSSPPHTTAPAKSPVMGLYFRSSSYEHSTRSSISDDDDDDEDDETEDHDADGPIREANLPNRRSTGNHSGTAAAAGGEEEDDDDDDDDNHSVQSNMTDVSAASRGSRVWKGAQKCGSLLKGGTTAVVKGSSRVVVGGTSALYGGTTAVVKNGSNFIVGGTTAVVKGAYGGTTAVVKGAYGGTTAVVKGAYGGTTAVVKGAYGGTTAVVKGAYGGTTAVVKGGSNLLVGGTTAVVKGSSKAFVSGTKKTAKALRASSAHFRPGQRRELAAFGRRNSSSSQTWLVQKSAAQLQWDETMAVLQDMLQPGSTVHQALDATQLKSLHKVKKILLHQGPSAFSMGHYHHGGVPASPSGDNRGVIDHACLPKNLLEIEKQNQKRMFQRRNSNTSSVNHNEKYETGSVQSDASYLLQEYGGIRNATALLMSTASRDFDTDGDDDELDAVDFFDGTSDISMSENRDADWPALLPPNIGGSYSSNHSSTSVFDQPKLMGTGDSKDGDKTLASSLGTLSTAPEDKHGAAGVTTTTTESGSSHAEKAPMPAGTAPSKPNAAVGAHPKIKKKKIIPRPPPPMVTFVLTHMTAAQKDPIYTTSVPLEFIQLGGANAAKSIETQRAVCDMLRWESLSNWEFNIFDLDRLTGGNALLFMGWAILGAPYSQYAMAHACGLAAEFDAFTGYPFMDKLNIPPPKLIQYLRVIQQDYHAENPYHNSIHAADVLQTVHCMIQMALQTTTKPAKPSSSTDVGGDDNPKQGETREEVGFFVRSCPNHLKLFSILLAAVVHDVDHPGKNNAFHTKLKAELAIVYHDKAVLENWHIAHAFARMLGLDLLNSRDFHKKDYSSLREESDCNLLCNASEDDFAAIRTMMVDAILQTDMTKHFAIVTQVKSMLMQIEEEEKSGPIRHDDDRTWTLLMYMLHQADISGQAKDDPLFLVWSDRCQQEFFNQGDQEAELGMLPISPYCDRATTNQAASQTGFVEFVIQPSYSVLGEYIPVIRRNVLPIIQENLDFWYEAAGIKQEKDDVVEEDEEEGSGESALVHNDEGEPTNNDTLENVEEEDGDDDVTNNNDLQSV